MARRLRIPFAAGVAAAARKISVKREPVDRGITYLIYLNRALLVLLGLVCLFFQLTFIGAPNWMPLPWTGVRDFVGGKDGSVYIAMLGERVLRYDDDGEFVASYKTGPVMMEGNGSDMHLAADVEGRIYLKIDDEIRVYSPDWQEYRDMRFDWNLPWASPDERLKRAWRLGAAGNIEFASRSTLTYHPRAVAPGELLFSGRIRSGQREKFVYPDESRLERRGDNVVRSSESGAVQAIYSQAWYLWPFGNVVTRYVGSFVVFVIALIFVLGIDERLRAARKPRKTTL